LFCTRSTVHLKKAVVLPHILGISLVSVCQERVRARAPAAGRDASKRHFRDRFSVPISYGF
jgi:hypothetical protein